MQKLVFVASLCLLAGACATQQQAAGTAVGAGAGALVGGPVGRSWVPVSVPSRRRPEEPSTRFRPHPSAAGSSGAAEAFMAAFQRKKARCRTGPRVASAASGQNLKLTHEGVKRQRPGVATGPRIVSAMSGQNLKLRPARMVWKSKESSPMLTLLKTSWSRSNSA